MTNRKFSLIELMIVMAVLAILLSLLSPSLKSVIGKSVQLQCMNNEKSISLSIQVYQHDYSDAYPYGIPQKPGAFNYATFGISKPHQELLLSYLSEPKTDYICPADETPEDYWWWKFKDNSNYLKTANGSSYMFSEHCVLGMALAKKTMLKSHNIFEPSSLGYMVDGRAYPNGWNWSKANVYNDKSRVDWSHLDTTNFLFADGHVESIFSIDANQVRTIPWE